MRNRQLDAYIWDKDLIADKMIFLSGPRQIGKTTWAKAQLNPDTYSNYYNWDNPVTRKLYRENPLFLLTNASPGEITVFDEIHKRTNWKDILKGIYDSIDPAIRLIITGSARLEWFRKSGDSLIGRYSHFHLFPWSLSELCNASFSNLWLCSESDWKDPIESLMSKLDGVTVLKEKKEIIDDLLHYSGFPEPFEMQSSRFTKKWHSDYLSLILTEDLRDLTNIKDINRMESITALLPSRIGSPLSVNSFAHDIETDHHTLQNSFKQLEKLWLIFSLSPWHKKLHRALKKEKKSYFVNWMFCKEPAARFENFIAVQLLRACTILNDCGFGNAELWYIRTFDKTECDFLITLDDTPAILLDAKMQDTTISRRHHTLSDTMGIPFIQIINLSGVYKKVAKNRIVLSADRFLSVLP
ncbi:MAG: AAA family ATPase [Chitinivibrionales bacterium]|nr:AAA family ATPase [Chitinivibrionales bacterium]